MRQPPGCFGHRARGGGPQNRSPAVFPFQLGDAFHDPSDRFEVIARLADIENVEFVEEAGTGRIYEARRLVNGNEYDQGRSTGPNRYRWRRTRRRCCTPSSGKPCRGWPSG